MFSKGFWFMAHVLVQKQKKSSQAFPNGMYTSDQHVERNDMALPELDFWLKHYYCVAQSDVLLIRFIFYVIIYWLELPFCSLQHSHYQCVGFYWLKKEFVKLKLKPCAISSSSVPPTPAPCLSTCPLLKFTWALRWREWREQATCALKTKSSILCLLQGK